MLLDNSPAHTIPNSALAPKSRGPVQFPQLLMLQMGNFLTIWNAVDLIAFKEKWKDLNEKF